VPFREFFGVKALVNLGKGRFVGVDSINLSIVRKDPVSDAPYCRFLPEFPLYGQLITGFVCSGVVGRKDSQADPVIVYIA
jgi:hypothetical protein